MNTASKLSMQRSASWGSKSEIENCEKRSQPGNKIEGPKKTCEKFSRRRLTGRAYKNILKSWAKDSNKPAGSPQKGDEHSGGAGRDTNSNGSIGADKVAIERSLSPLKKQRGEPHLRSIELMGKSINTSSTICMELSSSCGSKSENEDREKRSQPGVKSEGLKKTCENFSTRRLTGRAYKNILKSWGKDFNKPDVSPQKGEEHSGGAGRDTKSYGSIGADEVAIERLLSPLKMQRLDSDSKKELSKDSSNTCTKPISDSHLKDEEDLNVCRTLEWAEVEQKSNDKESTDHQLDAEMTKGHTESVKKAAKRTCSIENSASIQLKPELKRKRSCRTRKGKTSSALEFIDRKETKMQGPSKTLAEYISERKKRKSLQDRDGKETALSGKEEFPLKTTKPNCGKNGLLSGKQSQSDRAVGQIIKNLPASELISTRLTKSEEQIFPAHSSKGEQKQIRTDHSLEDSTVLEGQTIVACNSHIPQAASIPLEDRHSILSGQEERDLEIIMQKVVEQASKIKLDKKSQLQADANKAYSKRPINFVARPITSNYSASPPLSNQTVLTNKPKTLHLGNLLPAIGIRAMPPHLRSTCPASSQHLTDSTSKKSLSASGEPVEASSLSTPVLPYPAGPSSRPLGPTYHPVSGIRAPVSNHKCSSLPAKVSPPCYSQAHKGRDDSHLTTSPKPASGCSLVKTLSDTEKATDISSLSTSDLLRQFFTQMKKK